VVIGVTGDTHNNLKNIQEICAIFNQNGADLVVHTGDISLPKSLLAFRDLNCPLLAVFGNNDIEERKDLEEASKKFDCILFEEPHSFSLKDINILILHHPELIDNKMVKDHDLILHGHTHLYRLEKKMNCIIFNPGECAGIMKGKNQIGIIDLNNLRPKIINF
tara:strand:+ start:1915 stop:2403 length:489 start_codon:yes stop_codon:yes gene_type:complete